MVCRFHNFQKIIILPLLLAGFFSIAPSARADTATINAALGDGDATYSFGGCNQATWSQVRNISSASSRSYTSGERSPAVWNGQCANGVDVVIRRAFFPFDTSALPDGAVVTAATLNIYVPAVTNTLNDGNDFLSVVKSNQASSATLQVADYGITDFTEGSSRIDISSISVGSWVSLSLSAAGRSWISTTGNTMLAVLDGHDVLNIYNPASGQNMVGMRFANYGGAYVPYLQVTYIASAPDTTPPTVSITAPAGGSTVSGTATTVSANASDNIGVVGVQFKVDGTNIGAEDTASPYSVSWNTTAVANGSHTLTAVARDAAGNSATSAGVSVTVNNIVPDTTPPSVPTGLNASAVSSSQINLLWSASTDTGGSGLAGYNVYRNGGATAINTSLVTTTSYSDTGRTPSTSYSYTVEAQDGVGNKSAKSSPVSATTQAPPPPPNVSGHAWADDIIGWIKMSGTATDGSPYGVLVSSASPGVLSGYAWANPNDGAQNNIGWIDFGPAGAYPASSFVPAQSARMNRTTGLVSGWARACSVFASGCSGALKDDTERGGWDGWIGFGTGGNYTQPVTVSGCNWSGYAWGGGTTIGWIHFGGASYPVTGSGDGCTTSADLTATAVSSTAAVAGTATPLSVTISNIGAGSTGAGFTNLFQFDNNADHTTVTDTRTDTSPAVSAGGTDVSQVSYTFPTAGTWYVRACSDNNSSFVGTITESNESNNCGASWTPVTVSSPLLTGTFSASLNTIDPSNPSTLTWTSNATTCTGAGFSTGVGSPANGNTTVTPLVTSPYQITCTRSGYTPLTLATTVTVTSVTTSISAKPSCISGGGSSKISWSVLPVSQIQPGSCRLSGPGLSSNPLPVSPDGSAPNASPQTATVPSSMSTYTISCTTTGGATVTKSAVVDVTSCWTEF